MEHPHRSSRTAARRAGLALVTAGLLAPMTVGLTTVLASPAQAALVKTDDEPAKTSSPKPTATGSSTTVTTSKQEPTASPTPTATRTRSASPSPTPTKTATAKPSSTATASPTPTRSVAPVAEPEETPTQAIAPVTIPSTAPVQNLAPLAPVAAPVVQGPVVAGSPTRTVISAPVPGGRSVTAPLTRPVRPTVAALLAPVPSRSTDLSAALQPLAPGRITSAPLGAAIFDAPGDPAGMGPMPRPFGPSKDGSAGPAAGPRASSPLDGTLASSSVGPNGFALALLALGALLALYAVATITRAFERLGAVARRRRRPRARRPLPILPV